MLKLFKQYSVLIGVVLIALASYYVGMKLFSLLIALLTASYAIGWAVQFPMKYNFGTRTHTGKIWFPGVGLLAMFYIASLVLVPADIVSLLVIGIPLFGFVGLLHKVWQTIPFHRV